MIVEKEMEEKKVFQDETQFAESSIFSNFS